MVKGARVCVAVAGNPIDHSLTPLLFQHIAQHLQEKGHTISFDTCDKISRDYLVDALGWGHAQQTAITKRDEGADLGKREIWLSLTTPLKHQLPYDSGAIWAVGDPLIASVNQMRHDGHIWKVANTDGLGLLIVAQEFGFDFTIQDEIERPLLCMTGGGSTARACAAAWASTGGRIWWKGGRRKLSSRGPWKNHLVDAKDVCDHIGRRLHVNFDQEPGTAPEIEGERIGTGNDAPIFLSVSYSEDNYELVVENEWGIHLDGRWLLVAQHLEAWTHLFWPEIAEDLPPFGDLVEWLDSN
ncbi:MAG: hypothetical protein HOE69_05685 [Euryarchaeota archaeon]|jgi:hypothetical protein|nr:hypothetical protein [Euryarchaeota archaeon]